MSLRYRLIWVLLSISGFIPILAQAKASSETVITPSENGFAYLPKQERLFLQEVDLKQKITTEGRAATIRLAEVYSNMDDPEMRAKVFSLMAPLAEEGYVKAQWLLAYGDSFGRYGTFSDSNAKHYQATQKNKEMTSAFSELIAELNRDKQNVRNHLKKLQQWYQTNHQLCSQPPKRAPTQIDSPEDYIAVRYLTDCLLNYETQTKPENRLLALSAYHNIVCASTATSNCLTNGLDRMAKSNKNELTTINNQVDVARTLTYIRYNQHIRFHVPKIMDAKPSVSKSTQWEIDFARGAISDNREEDAIQRLEKYQKNNALQSPDKQYVALFLGLSQMKSNPLQAIQNLTIAIDENQLSPWRQLLAEDMLCELYMAQKQYTDLIHIRLKQFSRLPERDKILPSRLFDEKI